MAYRQDSDLDFLKDCSNDDLNILVEYLTKDKDGEKRLTESITNKPLYRKYYPDHKKYWKNIAEELQLYGANSLVSIFRGNEGILYKEILIDVAKRFKCDLEDGDEVEAIEKSLILKILSDSIEEMSPEELEQLVEQLNLDSTNMVKEQVKASLVNAWSVGSKSIILMGTGILARVVGIRLGLSALALVGAGAAGVGSTALGVLTGPVGIAALAGLSLTGPAYRITIPCVVQIAYMRMKRNA